MPKLAVGALGGVYGDIGTSPLYAIRECVTARRKRVFGYLSRNSRAATDFFSIPPNRLVEIGTQVEL